MALCHECGSEVAENDVFCPFCGISLESLPVGESAAADPFEHTVVMSLPEHSAKKVEIPAEQEKPKPETLHTDAPAAPENIAEPKPAEETPKTEPPMPDLLKEIVAGHEKTVAVGEPVEEIFAAEPVATVETAPEVESPSELEKDEKPADLPISEPSKELAFDHVDEPVAVSEIEQPSESLELASGHVEADPDETATQIYSFSGQLPFSEPEKPAEEDLPVTEDSIPVSLDHPSMSAEPLSASEPETNLATEESPTKLEETPATSVTEGSKPLPEPPSEPFSEVPAEEPLFSAPLVSPDKITDESLNLESAPVTGEPLQAGDAGSVKKITNDFDGPADNPDQVTNPQTSSSMGTGDSDGKKSSLKPLTEGVVLNNRYEIVRKIGGGGMGAVYLALDKNLGGVERAVKEMVQSHIEEDQQQKAVDDFKRESMILSTLDHPAIPTIFDYFYDEPECRFYLVMKYISGGDLASKLRGAPGGRIDERTVTEWALQIIDVLSYLHGLPTTIVYRDLKPSNVMIDASGRIMLIDFGIARSINQKQEKGVTAVGTMGYAPPELFSGNVEPRSDIYSLGSTMFHLLTGADPQNNPLLIFDFQKNPRPRQINPQLSDQMERILMRAVEYNAEARFTTAAEMRIVLADHLDNLKRGNLTFGVTEIPDAVSLANQSVFCGFCGQRIVATDLFCAFCGAKQPIAQQGVHSEIYSRSSPTAKLVIDGTSELDVPAFSLEKSDNLVGRRDPMSNIFPEVDLSKYDPQTKISRRHARIWNDGGKFMVEDLGSSNGTMLLAGITDSFRLIPHKPHPLASGDRIRVGDTTLHFLVG